MVVPWRSIEASGGAMKAHGSALPGIGRTLKSVAMSWVDISVQWQCDETYGSIHAALAWRPWNRHGSAMPGGCAMAVI